jgi:phosphoglycolate phosphatase-like HAD superfamily hydrolase
MNLMNLVAFDVDGTLTKTFAVDGECYLQAFADSFGITNINDNWSDYEHVTDLGVMQQVFEQRLGRAPGSEEIARFVNCFVGLLQQRYNVAGDSFGEIAGASAFLTRLPEFHWAAAIATGGWERSARFKMAAAGIRANLPAAFAEDGPARSAIAQKAIARAHTHYQESGFQRVVLVGDAVWDLETARELERPFVGVAHGARMAQLRKRGTSHVIEHFLDDIACVRCLDEARIPRNAGS